MFLKPRFLITELPAPVNRSTANRCRLLAKCCWRSANSCRLTDVHYFEHCAITFPNVAHRHGPGLGYQFSLASHFPTPLGLFTRTCPVLQTPQ